MLGCYNVIAYHQILGMPLKASDKGVWQRMEQNGSFRALSMVGIEVGIRSDPET
jgi:hypothetical protein